MAEPLFIAQAKLEALVEEKKVRFEDGVLTILGDQKSYHLQAAVRFTKMIEGNDSKGWLGQVKSHAELQNLGAEHFPNTVLVGEIGYECEEGFVGEALSAATEAANEAAAATASATESRKDVDLLSDFFLKNM